MNSFPLNIQAPTSKKRNPIEQTITELIPRYSEPLPFELIELTNYLYEQSNKKCSLKQNEEIIRVHACAHIACERLKSSLNLPLIESKPPMVKSSYDKLYEYFTRKLSPETPAHSRSKRVPSTSAREHQFSPTKRPLSQQNLRKDLPTATQSSSQKRKRGFVYPSNSEKEELIPRWVGTVIRYICKQTETGKMMPHILVGVESIIDLQKSFGQPGLKLPATIAAIWLLVVSRLRHNEKNLPGNFERRAEIYECLLSAKNSQQLIQTIGNSPEAWLGWETFEDQDIDVCIEGISCLPWKKTDWWRNLENSTIQDEAREFGAILEHDHDIEMEDGNDENDNNHVKQNFSKKARVIPDKYDYLSQERRQEYEKWKNKVLLQISTMISVED